MEKNPTFQIKKYIKKTSQQAVTMFFWYFIQGQPSHEIVYILIFRGTHIQQQFVKSNAAISECT